MTILASNQKQNFCYDIFTVYFYQHFVKYLYVLLLDILVINVAIIYIIYKNKMTAMSRYLPNLLSEANVREIVCRENGSKISAWFYLFTEQKKHNYDIIIQS